MLFSQRTGLKPAKKLCQRESLDKDTRIGIWNVLTVCLWNRWEPMPGPYSANSRGRDSGRIEHLIDVLWANFFKLPLDRVPIFDPKRDPSAHSVLRSAVMNSSWNEVFDLIEFLVKHVPTEWKQDLQKSLNHILETEASAYRIIDCEIAEITDGNEIDAVESAMRSSVESVAIHLTRALELLTDRGSPDYRNSMKESISAVEAMCQEVTGQPGATLGACLKAIKARHTLHPAFEQSLIKLYSFTSDSGGIRHAMTDESEKPTYADAKFMLVSCSALTNYFRASLLG